MALWAAVFASLRCLSPFNLIRWVLESFLPDRHRYALVEVWAAAHTPAAIVAAALAVKYPLSFLALVLVWYGALRVFEVVVYEVNVLLFDQWRAAKAGRPFSLRGYRRILLLQLHNYAEFVGWFATFLAVAASRAWVQPLSLSLPQALHDGLLLMLTFSTGHVESASNRGAAALLLMATIGAFMTLLVVARLISLLPTPETQDLDER